MKIVLINPPQSVSYIHPPIGLALIAAVLERKHYQVSILDANALRIEPESLTTYVADADVVGLTAMTPTINATVNIARHVKHANPGLFIILGGAHATLLPEETLSSAPEVDVIVRGEGEKTVIELLHALEHKQSLDDIPGITYRKDGRIASNPARPMNVDLDSLPFFAYHLLPQQKYKPQAPHGRVLPITNMITSRGCPYHCAYCSKPVFGSKYRAMSVERVLEEIAYYKKQLGTREICFYDDVFTLDKKRAYAIADEMLNKGLKIHWTCETRVNLVDKELLRHMKQSGCYSISYGIESGTQEILDIIHKDITLEQAKEAVRITREVGIQVVGYFMIGCPGESPETIKTTIEFAKKLRLDVAQFAIAIPFPGTELYKIYMNTNKGCDVPWEDFDYEGLNRNTAPVFESNELKRKDLQSWTRTAYKQFYLRPSYSWQRLRNVRSIGDLRVNLSGFSRLMHGLVSSPREP